MFSRVLWYCNELSRNQWFKPDELGKLQVNRLRAILRHAYENVALYRAKFDSIGIKPDDIKNLEDLPKLPFTTKQELLDVQGKCIARGFNIKDLVKMSTSGTSGGPMDIFYDRRFWDYCVANRYYRRARALGLVPWSRVLEIQYSRSIDTDGERDRTGESISRGRQSLGPSISLFRRWNKKAYIAYSGEEIVSDVVSNKPMIVYASPSYLRLLAETVADRGIRDINPNTLISWGEVLDEPTRNYLISSFGCDVLDSYGANEIGPIASECRRREGLHITADFLILEVVRNGQPVGIGERGEIVVTGLLNYAMPLIRYRIGDVGILDDRRCSCGRGFPLLKSIEGRAVDCFTLSDGRVVTPKSIQTAIQGTHGVSRYQAVQLNEKKVSVELMRKEGDPEVSTGQLIERCHKVLGDTVEIEVTFGDRRNLKAKFRPVISRLTLSGEQRWIKPRSE